MCIAIPMEVVHIDPNGKALARQESLEVEIDISLIEDLKPGDYVIVHAGFAIEVLDLAEAQERLKLFQDIADSLESL